MPSIANQDFKIYGRLDSAMGVPAKYCGELYAALAARKSFDDEEEIVDGFVVISTRDGIARMVSPGVYYDTESGDREIVSPKHSKPGYYEVLWAIQQAAYALDESVLAEDLEFSIAANGRFTESGSGHNIVNEDGYLIKGTGVDGKLASLYVSDEKASDGGIPIHFESLLSLVGELPLETTEIW